MDDRELDALLGTGGSFQSFPVLTIDNGEDVVGTNATGAFVTKRWDSEAKKPIRDTFAQVFDGVVLAVRAQLKDKGARATWQSDEFDALNKEAKIAIVKLANGMPVKDADGNRIVQYMTYEEIQNSPVMKTPKADGTKSSTYDYFIVLYIGVNGKIMKLKFKGAGRGNWFDYMKVIRNLGAQVYGVVTSFSTYIDKETAKYTVQFELVEDQQVDAEAIRALRIEVANDFKRQSGNALPSGATAKAIEPSKGYSKDDPAYAGVPVVGEKIEAAQSAPIDAEEVPFES